MSKRFWTYVIVAGLALPVTHGCAERGGRRKASAVKKGANKNKDKKGAKDKKDAKGAEKVEVKPAKPASETPTPAKGE